MQGDERKDAALVARFLSMSEQEFRFLEEKHGFLYYSGLVSFQNNYKIIKPFNADAVYEADSLKQAVTCYEHQDRLIEIVFNHEDAVIDSFYTFEKSYRLQMVDILRAARKTVLPVDGFSNISDEKALKSALSDLQHAYLKYEDYLIHPKAKLLEKAYGIKSKRLEHAIKERFRVQLEDASRAAALAFRRRDYTHVIEILQPYEDHLGKSDFRKLELSRKNILKRQV